MKGKATGNMTALVEEDEDGVDEDNDEDVEVE